MFLTSKCSSTGRLVHAVFMEFLSCIHISRNIIKTASTSLPVDEHLMFETCRRQFYRCIVQFDIYKVQTPINALFIILDKVLKFTLKITLTCSYMFRSTTIIRKPSLEPS